jgi:hypothetical protein
MSAESTGRKLPAMTDLLQLQSAFGHRRFSHQPVCPPSCASVGFEWVFCSFSERKLGALIEDPAMTAYEKRQKSRRAFR